MYMYKTEDGKIIKTTEQELGNVEEVVVELERLYQRKSAIEACYEQSRIQMEKEVPLLNEQITLLTKEAQKMPVEDTLDEITLTKLQQFNII